MDAARPAGDVSPPRISVISARDDVARGRALLIDVRDASAWRDAHAEGAVHVPVDELEPRIEEVRQLAAGRPVITTCGGGTRGVRAATLLREHGIDAAVLQGGMRAWMSAGLPTERG